MAIMPMPQEAEMTPYDVAGALLLRDDILRCCSPLVITPDDAAATLMAAMPRHDIVDDADVCRLITYACVSCH